MSSKLKDIVIRLNYPFKPPPPPTKMWMDEYIKFLNFLKSNPEQQEKVLKTLEDYNQEYQKLADQLKSDLMKIYKKGKSR